MKKLTFLLPVLLLALSCKKEFKESSFQLVLLAGDNQTGLPNAELDGDIIVQVLQDGKPFFSAPITFEPNSGFAVPEMASAFSTKITSTDATGKVKLKWTLGCLGAQEMKLTLGSPGCDQGELTAGTCPKLGELTVHATAEAIGGWTQACGFGPLNFGFTRFNTEFMEFGDDLFVLNNNNVFVSTNDGVDWAAVNTPFGPPSQFISGFSVGTSGEWYMAIFSNGIFKSTDRGQTWSNFSGSNIFFSQPSEIFVRGNVVMVSDVGQSAIFRTDNGASSWEQVVVGGFSFGIFDRIVETSNDKWWLWDSNNTRMAYSTDKGATWSTVSVPSNVMAFPASEMTVNGEGNLVYLYKNSAKLMVYNPTTGAGTSKNFVNNPSNTQFVSFLQCFGTENWVDLYGPSGSLGIYTGSGNGTYTQVNTGTSEIPEVFYRTKKERLLIGNSKGLFVKL